MARISGVDIPREKRLEISLTYIFGIGLDDVPGDLRAHRRRPQHEGARPHRRGDHAPAQRHRRQPARRG